MRQYKSWIAALILGSTLSANAQQKEYGEQNIKREHPGDDHLP